MSITLMQARNLEPGDILHHTYHKNADGTPQRWKVNGRVKVWRKDPSRVKVPVKHGLRDFDYLTEDELEFVSLPEVEKE